MEGDAATCLEYGRESGRNLSPAPRFRIRKVRCWIAVLPHAIAWELAKEAVMTHRSIMEA